MGELDVGLRSQPVGSRHGISEGIAAVALSAVVVACGGETASGPRTDARGAGPDGANAGSSDASVGATGAGGANGGSTAGEPDPEGSVRPADARADRDEPPPCLTGSGATVLYEGNVDALAVDGTQVVIVNGSVQRIPLSGGPPVTIAMPLGPEDILMLLHGDVYFTEAQPVDTPDAQKPMFRNVFEFVPITGGTPTVVSDATFVSSTWTSDDESLYYPGPGGIAVLTPPSTRPVELPLDKTVLIDSIAVEGDSVYVAGAALDPSTSLLSGVIVRMGKDGGQAERIVETAEPIRHLVAGKDGLFWVQEPAGVLGSSTVVRSNLDGSGQTTLVEEMAWSLALADDFLYFGSDRIERVPTSGGTATDVVTGLRAPGMLAIAGSNIVWIDPISKPRSDPTVPRVMTACIPRE